MRDQILKTTAFLVGLAACADDPAGPGGGAGIDDPIVVESQDYTLQPGEERYYCYTTKLQEDVVVSGLVPTYGDGTHHIILAQSIVDEPEGFEECTVLFKTTWIPLFLGGKGTTPVQFPEGAGYKLTKGTPIVMQLHLQNPGEAPMTAKTLVAMTRLDPALPFTPAGIFGLDKRTFEIPPQSLNYETGMTCDSHGKTLEVFATLPHMHKRGRHVQVMRNEADLLFEGAWDFDQQSTTSQRMTITPSDKIKLSCRFDNPTAAAIKYGESSDDEMCAFVFYYTPFTGLDGCLD